MGKRQKKGIEYCKSSILFTGENLISRKIEENKINTIQ